MTGEVMILRKRTKKRIIRYVNKDTRMKYISPCRHYFLIFRVVRLFLGSTQTWTLEFSASYVLPKLINILFNFFEGVFTRAIKTQTTMLLSKFQCTLPKQLWFYLCRHQLLLLQTKTTSYNSICYQIKTDKKHRGFGQCPSAHRIHYKRASCYVISSLQISVHACREAKIVKTYTTVAWML